jgi:hypothetical protein
MKNWTQLISKAPWPDRLAAAVWTLAVAMRIWGAWVSRCITEPDPAVVALMARHMAAFKEFPIFFYGQAYMGSLEPMASALMVRLMGPTGFAVSLGPVLFAAGALFFLWRWARDAAGPWGGLAALVAGGFGPSVYFQFQMAARGGYMVALCVDAAALWIAARMAAQLRNKEPVRWSRYLGLGMVAGIGAWSNLIVAPALGVAALLIAHGMRWKIWKHFAGIIAGFLGVAIGLIPWLIYNVRHEWASLAMSQIGGHAPPREAVLNSWNRFLLMQDSGKTAAGEFLPLILALGVLALAALGVWVMLSQGRKSTLRQNYARAAALLFCAAFVWVFVTSGFTRTRTARYWVPVVPGLVVLAAVACAAPGRRWRQGVAWTVLGGLAVVQATQSVSQMHAAGKRMEGYEATYREIGEAMEQTGADSLMAPIQLFPLNFALGERFAVSNGKQKFYEPILRQVELAEAPAYSSDFKGIKAFLRQQGATWESIPAGGRAILWNVQRPQLPLSEITNDEISSIRDIDGSDWKDRLLDRNLDTWWSPDVTDSAVLDWEFSTPQDLRAVQLVFSHSMADEAFDFARNIRIVAKVNGDWDSVLPDDPIIPLEWSGNRVYFPSGLARLEYRMDLQQVEALSVILMDSPAHARRVGWRLSEASVYVLDLSAAETTIDIGIEQVVQSDLTATVYAPRWFSYDLLRRGVAAEDRLAGLAPRVFGVSDTMPRDGRVDPDRNTMILVESPYTETTRRTLESQAKGVEEGTTGFWTAFTVDAGNWNVDGLNLPPAVVWTGDTLLIGNTAARAGEALRRLREGGESEQVQKALLAEILKWRPSALSGLSEEETRRLGGEAAVRARQAAACFPPVPCATEFANGIRLEGIDIDPETLTPGGEVTVRLFWSATEDFEAGQEIVFIHLRDADGDILAQDDYRGSPLLWGRDTVRPVPGEGIEDVRHIALPKSLPEGSVTVSVGLYQPKNGRRVKVLHSEAPDVRRNAATWPDRLQTAP